MSAEEAKAFGIIDEVVIKRAAELEELKVQALRRCLARNDGNLRALFAAWT